MAISAAVAAELAEFLHELTVAIERHYAAQLRRHYQAEPTAEHIPDPTNPPF